MSFSVQIFFSLLIITFVSEAKVVPEYSPACKSLLGEDLIKEIRSYVHVKEEIFRYVLNGDFKRRTYDE